MGYVYFLHKKQSLPPKSIKSLKKFISKYGESKFPFQINVFFQIFFIFPLDIHFFFILSFLMIWRTWARRGRRKSHYLWIFSNQKYAINTNSSFSLANPNPDQFVLESVLPPTFSLSRLFWLLYTRQIGLLALILLIAPLTSSPPRNYSFLFVFPLYFLSLFLFSFPFSPLLRSSLSLFLPSPLSPSPFAFASFILFPSSFIYLPLSKFHVPTNQSINQSTHPSIHPSISLIKFGQQTGKKTKDCFRFESNEVRWPKCWNSERKKRNERLCSRSANQQ